MPGGKLWTGHEVGLSLSFGLSFFSASSFLLASASFFSASLTRLRFLMSPVSPSYRSPPCFLSFLTSSTAFFHFQGAPYFAASFPTAPPIRLSSTLTSVSVQAPMSPLVMQSSASVIPSSSARIFASSLAASMALS